MLKVSTLAETFEVRIFCDCGAEYKFGGYVQAMYPPIYPHYCEKCNNVYGADKKYPCFETRVKDV